MFRKSFLAACILSMTLGFAHCQSLSEIKPLTIGDTLPDMTLHHLLRYGSDSLRTESLRGKVVVLDFFTTWCSPCIEFMPYLDSLQHQFGNRVQVLTISFQNTHVVDSLIHHNKSLTGIHLPVITEDKILSRLFPHFSYPHEVIIDGGGRVQAITYPYNVTRKTIKDAIDGKTLHLLVKKELVDFSTQRPLFYYGNGGDASQVYVRSTFCHYVEGLDRYYVTKLKDSVHKKYLFLNDNIFDLYARAIFPTPQSIQANRIVLEVKDTDRYLNRHKQIEDLWDAKNTYTYELIAPLQTSDSAMRQYMLEDLNRALNINGRYENRMTNCWALVRTTSSDSLYRRKGTKKDKLGYHFINMPFSTILNFLNYPQGPIVLDETGYTEGVDINLNGVKNLQNLPAVRKALQPYGLDLIPTRRMLRLFVITEKDFNKKSRQSQNESSQREAHMSTRSKYTLK